MARLNLQVQRMRASRTARQVKDANLTYLGWRKLSTLERVARAARSVRGDFIECGVALGGSAVLLGKLLPDGRELHLYDTFGMIPQTGERDDEESKRRYEVIRSGQSSGLGGDRYYGYQDDLYERVGRTLGQFDVRAERHRGLFVDTLHPEGLVALAHLDCDWYDSVKVCLDRIYPVLSRGGYFVVDDYADWGGAREATEEFLASVADVTLVAGGKPGTNVVLRRGISS